MRNVILDWNNKNAIIVKKGYLTNVQSNKGWEAIEAQKFRDDGFTLRNGTQYAVSTVEKMCAKNSFFSLGLPTV